MAFFAQAHQAHLVGLEVEAGNTGDRPQGKVPRPAYAGDRRLDYPLGRAPLAADPHPEHPGVPLGFDQVAIWVKLPLDGANPQPRRRGSLGFKHKGMRFRQVLLPEGCPRILQDFHGFAVGHRRTHPRPVAVALRPAKGNPQHIYPRQSLG